MENMDAAIALTEQPSDAVIVDARFLLHGPERNSCPTESLRACERRFDFGFVVSRVLTCFNPIPVVAILPAVLRMAPGEVLDVASQTNPGILRDTGC